MAVHIKQEHVEDDPVVKRIPVYLTKALLEKLYVFQYPLRSVTATKEKPNVIAARIKPKNQEVELEIEIPSDTPNFNRSKAEQIVINTDGLDKDENPDHLNFFSGYVMDKILYTSSRAPVDPGRFSVGLLHDGCLHLNPIQGILHVKPSFPYLDKQDKKLKAEMKEKEETGGDSDEEDDTPELVTAKFARTETDRSKSLREKSYDFMQKKNAEESWINTQFYEEGSAEFNSKWHKLICGSEDPAQNLTATKEQYISELFGPCPEADLLQKKVNMNAISMSHIKKVPQMVEQVKLLMANVKIVSFGRLCKTLDIKTEPDKNELLKVLQLVAEPVRGNWVVKSEILYPLPEKDKPAKLCGVTGVHPDIMVKARDYVIYLFNKNPPEMVNRAQVTKATKIPTEEMLVILQQLAFKNSENLWEFRLPEDKAFIAKYPKVIERHRMLSEAKLSKLHTGTGDFKAPKKEPTDSPSKSRSRRRSRQDSLSSDSGNEAAKKIGPKKK